MKSTFAQIAASAALFSLTLTGPAEAQVVFQADFNGAGPGTGGASDMVTFGGTATLFGNGGATATIASSPPLFSGDPGGYLQITTTGGGQAGATITPASAAHSPDAWFTAQNGGTSFDTLNGAIDFYFVDGLGSAQWTTSGLDFRPLDLSGGAGGLRLLITGNAAGQLETDFSAKNSGGTVVQSASGINSSVIVTPGGLYHLAITFSTNPTTGILTINTYLAPGNTPINPASSVYLISSASTAAAIPGTGGNAVTHAFNSAAGYSFGAGDGNGTAAKTLAFDSLRVYGSIPTVFNAVEYLPDLAVTGPSAHPTLPSNFDLFTPMVSSNAPGSNTPAMAEWTRTGNAGDGLVLSGNALSSNTGADYGKDSNFVVFGENGTSLLKTRAQIRHLDTNGISAAAIALDPALPAQSMYIIWPQNSNGSGTPIAVNQTEAWWLGPNIASSSSACFAVGQPISVYGRNLFLPGTGAIPPMIWIQTAVGNSGTWVTPTAYNPYKIDFTIPSSLSNGTTYQVWVHNGHGGAYGWSLCPQSLVLTAPIAWTGSTFNVMSYGAKGNGTTDDTTAIKNALTAAAAAATSSVGTTLSFPAGTYIITATLNLPSNVQWVGAGTGSTILKDGPSTNHLYMLSLPSGSANAWVSNLTLSGGTAVNTPYGSMLFSSSSNINTGAGQSTRFTNVNFDCSNNSTQSEIYLALPNNMFFEGCTFTGGGTTPVGGTQLFFDHCTLNMMYDGVGMNVKQGLNGFAVTNCTCQNYGTWQASLSSTNTAAIGTFSSTNTAPEGITGTNTVATLTSTNTVALGSTSGFVIGDGFIGPGIPANDTITGTSSGTVTLSARPSTGEPIGTVFSDVTNKVTLAHTSGFVIGNGIIGPGVPTNATITGTTSSTVTISADFTAAEPTGETFSNVTNTITLASTAGMASGGGNVLSGPGLPTNDPITNVSGNNVTVANYPTATEAKGATFYAENITNVGIGLFIKGLNGGGARNYLYYGNNTTIGIADENPDDNWGEQMSFEGDSAFYYGTPESGTVTGTSMTFDPSTMAAQGFVASGSAATQLGTVYFNQLTGVNGLIATIINGTGLGQSRNVTSYSLSSGVVTVSPPWNLPPDATSTVVLGWHVNDVVIYGNHQSGQPADCVPNIPIPESHGVLPYGGVCNLIVDSNTFTNFSSAVDDVGMGERDEPAGTVPASHIGPNFFHLIANNQFTGCRTGIIESPSGAALDSIAATYAFGHIMRNNAISSSTVEGIEFDTPTQPTVGGAPNFDMFLADDNVVTGCPASIVYTDFTGPAGWFNASQLGTTILTGNSLTLGGATNPGTVREGNPYGYGIYWQNRVSSSTALNGNSYSGFSSNYNKTTLGAILEEPLRPFNETASLTTGQPATDGMAIWNNGTASMSWTATSDSGWLTASPTSGSVLNENATGAVNFTCNPTGLTAGVYTGTITYTAGSQTKKALVDFTVQPADVAPSIASDSPPANLTTGMPFTFTYSASGYPAPTFSISSGTLPPGLALSSAGTLSGTPTQTGTYTFTVSASNGVGGNATQAVTILVGNTETASDTPAMPPWALAFLAMLLMLVGARSMRGGAREAP